MATFKYRAFISYSRFDRQWAQSLQQQLERYLLPNAIRLIRPGVRFDPRPLRPIFRDEDELVPGQDLPERIRQGLTLSEYLIVVCSTHAAASEWVSREIRDFIALGRRNNILAVVVDGEPNAQRNGHPAELECLPAELRFELDVITGDVDHTRGQPIVTLSTRPAEPLWVDWRRNNHRSRPMFLRVVAALLALDSLDDLVRKDVAYQRRRRALLWGAIGVAACCILSLAVGLTLQAQRAAREAYATLVGLSGKSAAAGDWESSARYALLAMRRAEGGLTGFASDAAEDALQGALLSNRRIGAPYRIETGEDVKIMLAADGSVLAVQNGKSAVQLLDAATGKPVRPSLQVESELAGISPDGTRLASSATIGEALETFQSNVWIWDVAHPTRPDPLVVQNPRSSDVEFSPNNRYLAALGDYPDFGQKASFFELSSRREIKPARHSDPNVESVAFSRDSTLMAVAGPEGVEVWNTSTGQPRSPLMRLGSNSGEKLIALSPDRNALAVGTGSGTLILWDLKRQWELARAVLPAGISQTGFSPDARRFAVRLASGAVRLWQSDEPLGFFSPDGSNLNHPTGDFGMSSDLVPGGAFAFLPDGRRMVTVQDGLVRVWKMDPYTRRAQARGNPVEISPDGKVLVGLTEDAQLISVDAETLAPAGPAVDLGRDTLTRLIAERTALKARLRLPFINPEVGLLGGERLAFSPRSDLVAMTSQSLGTWLVNYRTGEHGLLTEGFSNVSELTFSPDGKLLVSTSLVRVPRGETDPRTGKPAMEDRDFGAVLVWDVARRSLVGKPLLTSGDPGTPRFAPDGTTISLPGYEQKEIIAGQRRIRILPASKGDRFLAFTPDSKHYLVITDGENREFDELQLRDTATGAAIGPVWKTGIKSISDVVFNPDQSRSILIGNEQIIVFDWRNNLQIGAQLPIDATGYGRLHLSADGRRLLALDLMGILYEVDLGDALQLHGKALAAEVCRTLLPGTLSRLTASELAGTPLLNARTDAEACGR